MKRIKFNIFHINQETDIRIVDIVNGLLITEEVFRCTAHRKQVWKRVKP